MLCAHTIRRLKPGTTEQFLEDFRPGSEDLPAGWVAVTRDGSAVISDRTIRLGAGDGTLERRADTDKLAADVKALKVGHGLTKGVSIGPLINDEAVKKVTRLPRRTAIVAHVSKGGTGLMMESLTGTR